MDRRGCDGAAPRDLPGETRLGARRGPRFLRAAGAERGKRELVERFVIPRRSGRAWPVRAGQIFRIVAVEGPQVADLNVWSLANPRERFWASRTRQLHQAHLTAFDRLWSCLPYLPADADDHRRHHPVRPRRGRRRLPRPARHPLRPVRAQAPQRRGVRPLLPQQPRARGRAVSPDRARRARRAQRVPGDRPHRRGPLLRQAEPGADAATSSSSSPRSTCWLRHLGVPARRSLVPVWGPSAGDPLAHLPPARRRDLAAGAGAARAGGRRRAVSGYGGGHGLREA